MENKDIHNTERIEEIRLNSLLPKVFEGEPIVSSQVWSSELILKRGQRYLIEAASGAGKSSLCAFIYGNRKDYLGNIFFNNCNIKDLTIGEWQKLRRENIAYLPQELMLFPEMSAIDNIRLKNNITGCVDEKRIDDWLSMMGIEERRDFPVGKMSVGQQQRVAIIRAICQPFDFILLDEPVSHLDERNNRLAAGLIEDVARENGAAIISTSVGNPLLLSDAVTISL